MAHSWQHSADDGESMQTSVLRLHKNAESENAHAQDGGDHTRGGERGREPGAPLQQADDPGHADRHEQVGDKLRDIQADGKCPPRELAGTALQHLSAGISGHFSLERLVGRRALLTERLSSNPSHHNSP